MKLSFSISSKSSSRPAASNPPESFSSSRNRIRVDDDAAKQFVTEFDPSDKISVDAPSKLVIAPIPNADIWSQWKKKNLPLPTADDDASRESRFIVENPVNGSSDPGANQYGLLLRSNEVAKQGDFKPEKHEDPRERRFKEDIKDLPDEELPDVPVEGFGAAILAGYGWCKGKAIGRNCKVDPDVFEYKPMAGSAGLGYLPQAPTVGKKRQKEELAAGFKSVHETKSDNGDDYERKLQSKEREKRKYRRQDESSGEEIRNKDRLQDENIRAEKWMEDRRKEESSREEKRNKERRQDESIREEKRNKDRRQDESSREEKRNKDRWQDESSREEKRNKDRRQDESSREEKRSKKNVTTTDDKSLVRWLRSHIRVRIISKKVGGGKLYLKKGEVLDVISPTTCTIRIDGSRELVQDVDQKNLETALPKCGGSVLVLYGKHKGVFGSLVEKDSEKETGLVSDADSHEMISVSLHQIAEYVGDQSYFGY